MQLTEKEKIVLMKDWKGEKLTEDEKKILPIAKHKSDIIYEKLMKTTFDIYIAGRLDLDTIKRFDMIKEKISKYGLEVFNPLDVIQPSEKKGMLDFHALQTAKILFVATDKVSWGTSIEVGAMEYRKSKGENVKIIVCYLGKEFDYIKNHPMSIHIDYITQDLNDAFKKLEEYIHEIIN